MLSLIFPLLRNREHMFFTVSELYLWLYEEHFKLLILSPLPSNIISQVCCQEHHPYVKLERGEYISNGI